MRTDRDNHSDVYNDLSKPVRPRRVEVLNGVERRRKWPDETKFAIVAEALEPGVAISDVARVTTSILPSCLAGSGRSGARSWPPVDSRTRLVRRCSFRPAARIEEEIRGQGAEARRTARQTRTKPLVDKLKDWLEKQLARLSRGSTTADAFRYGLNHWTGLVRFLDDGRIELDSNTVERSMRPIALSRKNALFAGSDEGAKNWAAIASLIETAKLNGVNPHAWLADTLRSSSTAGPHPASTS